MRASRSHDPRAHTRAPTGRRRRLPRVPHHVSRGEVTEGKVDLTGYCMGARLAVLAAGMFPDRIGAVGGFHGGPLVTDSPDGPHLAAENITAEIYFAHAGKDAHMTPEHVAQFDKALDDASVRHRTETYEGVEHGFTQSDTAAYDAAADARHYRELLALFDRNLR
ncbi:dienelactone hydrolase family protein [Rhodococcus sp. NPDC058521]|uniref:dienelactone hydrolase family protein n=1 Tax=Rhodococcus sp. NPDC058521 TaxID=3346536 RepID=UPI00364E0A84